MTSRNQVPLHESTTTFLLRVRRADFLYDGVKPVQPINRMSVRVVGLQLTTVSSLR